jgi:hypothetical protein
VKPVVEEGLAAALIHCVEVHGTSLEGQGRLGGREAGGWAGGRQAGMQGSG